MPAAAVVAFAVVAVESVTVAASTCSNAAGQVGPNEKTSLATQTQEQESTEYSPSHMDHTSPSPAGNRIVSTKPKLEQHQINTS